MNQKNNNKRKSTQIEIYPADFRKCFFVLKTEISELELSFLKTQLERRTNFNLKKEDSIYAISNEFILWFIGGIAPALSDFGLVLSQTIKSKIIQKMDWSNN